jgi:autotransporter-associated beta strand protein
MKLHPHFRAILATAITSSLFLSYAHAADGTWNVDANGLWSTSSNWLSNTIADGSGSTANFTYDITADRTVSLDADRTLTSLVFGDSATGTAGSWILDNNGTSTNNLILAGTTPGITVNALGTGENATISAIIQGNAGLVKSGTGTLTLTGVNAYTGTARISAGTVRVTGAGKLGADYVSIVLDDVAGATLDFTGISSSRIYGNLSGGGTNGGNLVLGGSTTYFGNGASNNTYGGIISGTGNIAYGGTGTQTLTGSNTFDGTTWIQKGTLSISSISSINGGASSVGNATTATNGRIWLGDKTTTGTLLYTGSGHTTDRVFNLNGTTGGATFDASGSGALVITSAFTAISLGSKTLTLTGNNTADNTIGGAIVNNTTTGSTATTAASTASTALVRASVAGLTVGNAISGTGITGGTTIIAINTATKTVTLSAAATVATAATITSAGLVNITSLTKAGTGKWILSGNNTYTGGTTVSTGTLLINGNSTAATGAVSVSAGATLGGNGTIGGATSLATTAKLDSIGSTLSFTKDAANALNLSGITGGGNLLFDLSTNDKVTLTSTTANALNVGTLDFADFTFSGATVGIYTLFDANSAILGSIGTASGDLGGGLTGTLSFGGTNDVLFSVVPEPATWALLAFSLTTVMVLRRRRNS